MSIFADPERVEVIINSARVSAEFELKETRDLFRKLFGEDPAEVADRSKRWRAMAEAIAQEPAPGPIEGLPAYKRHNWARRLLGR